MSGMDKDRLKADVREAADKMSGIMMEYVEKDKPNRAVLFGIRNDTEMIWGTMGNSLLVERTLIRGISGLLVQNFDPGQAMEIARRIGKEIKKNVRREFREMEEKALDRALGGESCAEGAADGGGQEGGAGPEG